MTTIKQIFLTLFLASSGSLFAQEITGNVTSETGEGVPFTSIFLRERNIGIVSDINGYYRLPTDILENVGDTLIFSSIGFDTQRFPVAEFAEKVAAGNTDIVLIANYILLSEVVVTPRQPQDYGFFHIRRGFPISITGTSGRFMVFIENTSDAPKLIQTVNVRLTSTNDDGFKLRVFFYQKTDDGLQNINVGENIFITDLSQTRIQHDVSELHIPFPAEGILMGIEIIGEENVMQERSEPVPISFSGTSRARGVDLYFYDEEDSEWKNVRAKINEAVVEELPRVVRVTFGNVIRNMTPMIGLTAH